MEKEQQNQKLNILYEYETAIKAREFHYKNFNYWANLYAIIIGALFIAFYTIFLSDCEKDEMYYLMLCMITFMGSAISFAWLQTVRGHYHWLKNWINIVLYYEGKIVGENGDDKRVYSLFFDDEDGNKNKNDKCCLLKSKNISTQEITIRVILILYIAWILLFLYSIGVLYKKIDIDHSFIAILGVILILISVLLPIIFFNCNVKSNVDYHYKLKRIKKDGESIYEICSPEK